MPDKPPDQEPSIEEILASIRQIISDDDEPSAESAPAPIPEPAPPPAPLPPPKAVPPPPPPSKPDVLELTDIVEDEHEEEPEPLPEPEPEPMPRRMEIDMRDADEMSDKGDDLILSPGAASATFEGFVKLTSQMALDHEGTGNVTLETIVKALLKPMLREWLDSNLPPLIEKMVQKELDQIARKALDD